MDLDYLKKAYGKLAKKYALPSFEKFNGDFEIDKLEKDTDCLLRTLRKLMMEKIVNSMTFVDMLLNPVNAPRMYIPYITAMTVDDRKTIDKVYTALSAISLLSLDLEIDGNEKGEAVLIKKTFETWNSLKPGFRQIIGNIKKPRIMNNNRRERSYFG